MRKILTALLVLLLAGCAAPKPWIPTEKLYTAKGNDFTVELPDGWMRSGTAESLVATRDGVALQSIFAGRDDINKNPLQHTKKKIQKEMLPQELADIVLDNVISNPRVRDVRVESNSPVRISGIPGFRIAADYKNAAGLRIKIIYCGFLKGDFLYTVRYAAPERYYFDKDRETFENVLKTFRLTDAAEKK